MVIFYFAILALTLYSANFKKNGFFDDYLEKSQCNAIKGIFILVVFMRHVVPYVTKAGYKMPSLLDKIYNFCDGQIGQLLVVMFLFYSGYGVMVSIKQKGVDYVRSIPKRRVLSTFANFDIAVSLFLLMDFTFDIKVSTDQYFLSRFGWDSVGNSNWYIFIVLLCYYFSYISFKIRPVGGDFCVLFMSLLSIFLLSMVKESHWYNTLLCFPAGMLFTRYKEKFEAAAKKRYIFSLIMILLLLLFSHLFNILLPVILRAYMYNIESIFFALLVVLITMKVKINNRILIWLGLNLFPLYIYQRIPMIAMRELAGVEWLSIHPYIFVLASLVGTLIITYFYRFWRITI